ncbi:unnamed protein product [Protopolystoma xenopodis]|uniref:Uncharacterized protein n=1 Tax=Protopolystoma xenopodis TaxID=117903 RepID=A0A448WTF6_9PLAT|nr:unnamed protein product [Protopolystoma xenopodis]
MVDELHLSLIRGFWDDKLWGPIFDSAAPGGAEVWAWFEPNKNVDLLWSEMMHALSGLLCASLNQLSSSNQYIRPRWSYRPSGLTSNNISSRPDLYLRYAQLPGETVCTENLTPWSKLLPCKTLAGLASLLHPTSLYKSNYKSLKMDIRKMCWDEPCNYIGLELRQTLTVVFDRRFHYSTIQGNSLGPQVLCWAERLRIFVQLPIQVVFIS